MKSSLTFIVIASVFVMSCTQDNSDSTESTAAARPLEYQKEVALPDGFFLKESPTDVVSLAEARANARKGDEIKFNGYIGGRSAPFVEGRAIFLVADSEEAPACGDECAIPWDACCVPSDKIAANSATVQVVDAEGKALPIELNGQGGLTPGSEVTVIGTVREANDSIFIVDSTGLSVVN